MSQNMTCQKIDRIWIPFCYSLSLYNNLMWWIEFISTLNMMRPIFNDGKQDAEHLIIRSLEHAFHTQQKCSRASCVGWREISRGWEDICKSVQGTTLHTWSMYHVVSFNLVWFEEHLGGTFYPQTFWQSTIALCLQLGFFLWDLHWWGIYQLVV